jgi:hypothetical protein
MDSAIISQPLVDIFLCAKFSDMYLIDTVYHAIEDFGVLRVNITHTSKPCPKSAAD